MSSELDLVHYDAHRENGPHPKRDASLLPLRSDPLANHGSSQEDNWHGDPNRGIYAGWLRSVVKQKATFILALLIAAGILGVMVLPMHKPRYEASAYVHVSSAIPRLLYAAQDANHTASPGHYFYFIKTLRERCTSDEVLRGALAQLQAEGHDVSVDSKSIEQLRDSIRPEIIKDTNLIRITARSHDKTATAVSANAVARSLVNTFAAERSNDLKERRGPLLEQERELAPRHMKVVQAMEALPYRYDASLPDGRQNIFYDHMESMNTQLSAATMNRTAKEGALKMARKKAGQLKHPASKTLVDEAVAADRHFQETLAVEVERIRKLEGSLVGLGPEHPERTDLQAELDQARVARDLMEKEAREEHRSRIQSRQAEGARILLLEAEAELGSARHVEQTILADIEETRYQLEILSRSHAKLRRLGQDEERLRGELELVRGRLEELDMESQAPAQVTMSDGAVAPSRPSRDLRKMLIVGILLAASLFALLTVIIKERAQNRVVSEEDVEPLGLPVLSQGLKPLLPGILPSILEPGHRRGGMIVVGLGSSSDVVGAVANTLLKESAVQEVAALLTVEANPDGTDDMNQPVIREGRTLKYKALGHKDRLAVVMSQPLFLKTWDQMEDLAWMRIAVPPTSSSLEASGMLLRQGVPVISVITKNQVRRKELLQFSDRVRASGSRLAGVVLLDEEDRWAR